MARIKLEQRSHRSDSPHGPVTVELLYGGAAVRVGGPGIPAVEILAATTRAPRMTIDGTAALLEVRTRRPGRHGVRDTLRTRGNSWVQASVPAATYRLQPLDSRHARLLRDGRPVADATGGPRPSPDARLHWGPGVGQADVAVGHALAGAFGAGAHGLLWNLTAAWLDFLDQW